MNRHILLSGMVLVLCVASLSHNTIRGCAAPHRAGDRVNIADETALIVWDEETKTQHFIRRATFDTTAKDFGFLVPTPTQPELGEAHDYTFKMMAKATAPRVKVELNVVKRGGPGEAAVGNAASRVQVLETKRVGDFDAAVLKASDAESLNHWLTKNGYAVDPSLTDWLKPYVDRGWFLTAFKIVKDTNQPTPATASAVRMSFKADRPFFPYREPASQRETTGSAPPPRLLRVYMLSSKCMQGTLGEGNAAWPGTTVWSGTLPEGEDQFLLYTLKLHDKVKGTQWVLTEFEDRSSPRPGTDEVYFSPADNQSYITRPPIMHYLTHYEDSPGPFSPLQGFLMGLVLGGVLVALVGVLMVRRPRRDTAA